MSNGGNSLRFTISAVDRFSSTFRDVERSTHSFARSVEGMSERTQAMAADLRNAFQGTRETMRSFRESQIEVSHGFLQLTRSSGEYAGRTGEFMNALGALGRQQRSVSESMIANNDAMRMSFFQSIGAIMAASRQSDSIASNLQRMGNPLYTVNTGLLRISSSLEGVARSGNPAVLALQALGPTASMRDLQSQIRLINAGIMRMQAVALASGIAFALATAAIIKNAFAVNKALEPLSERLKGTWTKAFEPLATVVGVVLEKVMTFATKVGELVNRFNEANPVLAKMIQSFMYLTLGLTVLLSPLAVGIGLFGGIKAAMFAVWTLIGPLVTGLATVAGTAALLAGGIVLVTTAFILAYQKIEWFRNGVDAAWAWIKNAFSTSLNFIRTTVTTIMSAVSSFFGEQLGQIRSFWDKNGKQIMSIVALYFGMVKSNIQIVMSGIQAIFQTVWPIISGVVRIAFGLIKTIVSNTLSVVLGLISVGLSLLKGDWSSAWQTVKDTTKTMMQNTIKYLKDIDLADIGRDIMRGFLRGIDGMIGTIKDKVREIANLIPDSIKNILDIHSPSRVTEKLGDYIGQGLGLGISNSTKDILGNVSDVMKSVAGAFGFDGVQANPIGDDSEESKIIARKAIEMITLIAGKGKGVAFN